MPTRESLCGISTSFEELFPTIGQVNYVLLTRPPLSLRRETVRLACVKHAASVCPEPGSNSPNMNFCGNLSHRLPQLSFGRTDYGFFFITTLQLLMCLWQKENRRVSPTGDATHILDAWSRNLVSVVSLAPFCILGRHCADLSNYT